MAARNLAPVAATFVLFGFFWGSWAVAAANVERALGVSHAGFGLILSCGLAGAAVANAAGGAWAERLGTARLLGGASTIWGIVLIAAAAARPAGLLGLAMVAAMVTGGMVDVVMNVAATAALAATPGKLVRFHGGFNGGAALGAAAMGGSIAIGIGWRWVWLLAGLSAVVLGRVCRRSAIPASGAGDRVAARGALRILRSERLALIAVAFAVGAMVEGGVELWGVLYLRTHLASGLEFGAIGSVLGYLVAATARVGLGPAVGRRAAQGAVAAGALAACCGLVVLVAAPLPWLKAAGLVIAAGGVSMCWPLFIAHAGSGKSRPGPVVGAMSAVGYTGLVVGPAVVGWVASSWGLPAGLLFLAAAALFVAAVPTVPVVLRARDRAAPA